MKKLFLILIMVFLMAGVVWAEGELTPITNNDYSSQDDNSIAIDSSGSGSIYYIVGNSGDVNISTGQIDPDTGELEVIEVKAQTEYVVAGNPRWSFGVAVSNPTEYQQTAILKIGRMNYSLSVNGNSVYTTPVNELAGAGSYPLTLYSNEMTLTVIYIKLQE